MAWQITFPHEVSPISEAGGSVSRTVICRIEDGDEARSAAERLVGSPYFELPVVAKEIADDAAETLGIEAGACREFKSE